MGGESPGLSLQGREVSQGLGIPGSSLESRVREASLGGGVTKAAVSLRCDVGLRGDRTGTLVMEDHIRVLPCQEGSCRRLPSVLGETRLPSVLGETRLPPEGLQPVCARESWALTGFALGHRWHLG